MKTKSCDRGITYDNINEASRMKHLDQYRIYSGKTYDVEFYFTAKGEAPAYDYYLDLDESIRRRFLVIISHFADAPFGTILPKAVLNIEDKADGIYAFKPFIHRFFSFFTKGKKIVILNAYQKQSQQMTKQDRKVLELAKKMKNDYLTRVKEGTYYE